MAIAGMAHPAALIPTTTMATMLYHILITPAFTTFHTELTHPF